MRWTLTIIMTLALGCGLYSPEGETLPVPVDKNNPTVEICNGIDDDGDGRIDNGMLAMRWNSKSNNPQFALGDGIAQRAHSMFRREYVDAGDVPQASSTGDPYDKEWREGVHTTATFTYDKEGNVLTQEWLGIDGKLNKYFFRYDSDGKSTGLNYFLCEADMSTCEYELEARHIFDSEGRTVMDFYNQYEGPDRTLASRVTGEYTYRDDGKLLSNTRAFDLDADGTAESGSASYYTYGKDALLVLVEEDTDLDGTIDEIRHTTRDDTGLVVTVSKDNGADGTVDVVAIETYDAEAKLLSMSVDQGADGTVDRLLIHTYNAEGNRQEITSAWMTDGTVVRQTTRTFDKNGDMVMATTQADVDSDGELDVIHVKASTYDTDRKRLTHLIYLDSDKNGGLDRLRNEVYTYNADGNLVTHVQREDIDGDGTNDRLWNNTYIYDCDGNLVTGMFKYEDLVDGKGSSQTTNYSFACHGE
jgi:hypothetical protein